MNERRKPGVLAEAESSPHLIPLAGDWSLWKCVCVRGAGFPASLVLRLADPECARVVDEFLDAETVASREKTLALDGLTVAVASSAGDARARFQKALGRVRKGHVPEPVGTESIDEGIRRFGACRERSDAARVALATSFELATTRAATTMLEVARDDRFREAVAWQNRSAIGSCLEPLLRHAGGGGSKHRQREKLVASYLQRYCTKNDTIGFFGPVGWGTLSRSAEALVVKPGAGLVEHRSVHLEQWAVDALAATIAKDERIERFMAPRMFAFVQIDGERVHSAATGKHVLSLEQRSVLAACDGSRSANEIASVFVRTSPAAFPTAADVFSVLRELREQKLLAWTLEVPLRWNPEGALRAQLERVGDDDARREALAMLDELERARDAVGASAGNSAALDASLAVIEATFTRMTHAAPTRHSGAMYAARGVVFEDCRRDLELAIGSPILEAIGPSLALLLTSARWLTFEAGRAYRVSFTAIYADLSRRLGAKAVPFLDVWLRIQRVLFGAKERPIQAVVASLQQRWAEILAIPSGARRVNFSSEELSSKVARAFDAPGPGWREACHHSPDLMIAAASVEAIRHGDYEVILGEMHTGMNTLASALFVAQHPQQEELAGAMEQDLPDPRVAFVQSRDWPKTTLRTTAALVGAKDYALETGFDTAGPPRDRILKASALVVEEIEGSLVVRSLDGRVTADFLDFLGHQLSVVVISSYKMLAPETHSPRVTIDRLVVSRESWSFSTSELEFAFEDSELQQFVGARAWAHARGLPRFVYVKVAIETKPLYVDLESPVFVSILARLVRRVRENVAGETAINVTEMLPGMDQLWLPGPKGEVYTSELRIVARDHAQSVNRSTWEFAERPSTETEPP